MRDLASRADPIDVVVIGRDAAMGQIKEGWTTGYRGAKARASRAGSRRVMRRASRVGGAALDGAGVGNEQ